MGVPETDPLRRRIKLEDSIDSAKMQRAEPPPSPPQTVTVLLVAIDGHTLCRITDQLQPPHYQFCTSPTVNSALGLLQMEDLQVDLVLSNVSSKDDDDGYNFIAQVQRLRKNIPHVVIFEAEGLGDPEIISAKNLGACYILWKPLIEQSNVIKYLRQHVYVFTRSPHSENEGSSSLLSSQQKSLKRERDEQSSEKERESSKKQRRMVWDKDFDKDLNALFVKAVNELGDDAGPKRIQKSIRQLQTRELVGRLTRKQVASHLQKHREKEKKKKELHQHVTFSKSIKSNKHTDSED